MREFGLSKIEDSWVNEKTEKELTELPEDFYKNSASYISELARELEESEDLRRELIREELRWVLEMLQEIYFFRTLKMTEALVEEEETNFLPSERRAFEEIREELENLQEELLKPVMKGESELKPPREVSNTTVLMLSTVPEPIIAADMHYYGPFGEGDIVNIPENSARLLVKQGLARKLQIKEA